MDWSTEKILQEVQRIKYLYKMKGVFRYGTERDPWKRAESNAEHLYGMTVLVNYFLPLIDEEIDRQKVLDLLFVHDLDEIESGDIISYKKTDADRAREAQDMETTLDKLPQNLALDARALVHEYNAQETREAQFTKAIDKIEPLFEVFDKYGKEIMLRNKTTFDQAMRGKKQYIDHFRVLALFAETIGTEMQRQGYFYEDK